MPDGFIGFTKEEYVVPPVPVLNVTVVFTEKHPTPRDPSGMQAEYSNGLAILLLSAADSIIWVPL